MGAEDSTGEDDLHQPHDKLFAATFGVPENAAGLLRSTLPADLSAVIDWDSLRLEPGSFVDSRFRQSHSDLLFSAAVAGRETFLYVLFEHQSTRDPRLPLRLLTYMLRVWDRFDRLHPHPRKLPAILPVVLSQNAEIWDVPERLVELLDLPDELSGTFHPYIPDFGYRHLQLAGMTYEEIPGTSAGIFVLRAMKAERLGALLEDVVWEEDLLIQVPPELFEMVLRYILGRDIDRGAFETRLNKIGNPQIRSKAMTLAQVYRQEGRQEGLQKGRQEDIIEALDLRFGSSPKTVRDAIFAIEDEEKLRILLRGAIQSASIEQFIQLL
jgi:hypothetical protein